MTDLRTPENMLPEQSMPLTRQNVPDTGWISPPAAAAL